MFDEILRYMGHKGEFSKQIEDMISSCLKKLSSVCTPRYLAKKLLCTVDGDNVILDSLIIKSADLAARLSGCSQAYVFAVTLGADVDRLIAREALTDSAAALCMQACAAAQIENYCDGIESEFARNAVMRGLCFKKRFSPGYGDFDISYQTDVLRLLNAQKRIGVTETKTHMLSPLKSVTAVIGVADFDGAVKEKNAPVKCETCGKSNCRFRIERTAA